MRLILSNNSAAHEKNTDEENNLRTERMHCRSANHSTVDTEWPAYIFERIYRINNWVHYHNHDQARGFFYKLYSTCSSSRYEGARSSAQWFFNYAGTSWQNRCERRWSEMRQFTERGRIDWWEVWYDDCTDSNIIVVKVGCDRCRRGRTWSRWALFATMTRYRETVDTNNHDQISKKCFNGRNATLKLISAS